MDISGTRLGKWLPVNKTFVVCSSAVLCGIGTVILNISPPTFAIFATIALACHYTLRDAPSISCSLAYSNTIILELAYNKLESYFDLPHVVDYENDIPSLVAGAVLFIFGLKACELCGGWKLEQRLVWKAEIATAAISAYAVAAWYLDPHNSKMWQYAAGAEIAVVVFTTGTTLKLRNVESLDSTSREVQVVEKEKEEALRGEV